MRLTGFVRMVLFFGDTMVTYACLLDGAEIVDSPISNIVTVKTENSRARISDDAKAVRFVTAPINNELNRPLSLAFLEVD